MPPPPGAQANRAALAGRRGATATLPGPLLEQIGTRTSGSGRSDRCGLAWRSKAQARSSARGRLVRQSGRDLSCCTEQRDTAIVRASQTGGVGNPCSFRGSGSVVERQNARAMAAAVTLWPCCNLPAKANLIDQSAHKFGGDTGPPPSSSPRAELAERIDTHAEDDGFPAQEDPSKAASGTRGPASREEGGAARTKIARRFKPDGPQCRHERPLGADRRA